MPQRPPNSIGPIGLSYLTPNTTIIGASPQATGPGGLTYSAMGELPWTNIPPTPVGTPEVFPYGQTITIKGASYRAPGDYLGDQPWVHIP